MFSSFGRLVNTVFEEMASSALGFTHPHFHTDIQRFLKRLTKKRYTETFVSSKNDQSAHHWKLCAQKQAKTIDECTEVLKRFSPRNEVLDMTVVQYLVYFQLACVTMIKTHFTDFVKNCHFQNYQDMGDYSKELDMMEMFLKFITTMGHFTEDAIRKCPNEFIIFVLQHHEYKMDELCYQALEGKKCSKQAYKQLEDLKIRIASKMNFEIKKMEELQTPQIAENFARFTVFLD